MKNTIYTINVFIFLLCIFSFFSPVVIAANTSGNVLSIDIGEFSIIQIVIGCAIGVFIGIILDSVVWDYKRNKNL